MFKIRPKCAGVPAEGESCGEIIHQIKCAALEKLNKMTIILALCVIQIC
jgi:hypothetical protein